VFAFSTLTLLDVRQKWHFLSSNNLVSAVRIGFPAETVEVLGITDDDSGK